MAVVNPPDLPFIDSVFLRREFVPSFDEYPFSIPAIRHLHRLDLHLNVTFLVGENGTGKSTLLEAIAVADGFNAEGGTRNFDFASRKSHSELYKRLQLSRTVRRDRSDSFFYRAESFYNVATYVEDIGLHHGRSPYGDVRYHHQSHGEAFLNLFVNRFSGNGLFLLDEPESALSPQRQMSFIAAMHQFVGRGSQFIIATHSPIILAYPHAKIYSLGEDGIMAVDYEQTEHYKITKMFFARREKMLAELMSD